MKQVTYISMNFQRIGNEGVEALCSSPIASNLTYLSLAHNLIKKDGILFISHGAFHNLLTLKLDSNEVGAEGFAYLSSSHQMTNLLELYLENTGITDECLPQIANSPLLKQLNVLELRNNSISSTVRKEITEHKYPSKKCRVYIKR